MQDQQLRLRALAEELGVLLPLGLVDACRRSWSQTIAQVAFGFGGPTLDDGLELLSTSAHPIPPNLIPLALIDDRSLACVVCTPGDQQDAAGAGFVIRWHLGDIMTTHQGRLVDVDPILYLESLEEELRARPIGFALMTKSIFPEYERAYLAEDRKPRTFETRPMRLACQNVVAGLAAVAHDSSIDGLAVPAWQTCELPHVATHDANRAMTGLLLCEAFQNGGTMEIRFDGNSNYGRHPEGQVPASLRRFARTLGIELGAGDPANITPSEARELFLAVTPMPDELRERVEIATGTGHATPERLCYVLMAQIWREVELDFMLAVSPRVHSILRGGAPVPDRGSRQAESEVARAALILGMLYRRLDSKDTAKGDGSGIRVLEDNRHGITWSVVPGDAAVVFSDVPAGVLPWQARDGVTEFQGGEMTVFPRTVITPEVIEQLHNVDGPAAIVLPSDQYSIARDENEELQVLFCPDRLGQLDLAIEARLSRSRVGRA